MKKIIGLILGIIGINSLLMKKAEGSFTPTISSDVDPVTTLDIFESLPKRLDPFAAARGILDLIGKYESGGNYDISYGSGKYGSAKLTSMTLDEVRSYQETLLKNQRATGIPWQKTSSAVGKYQFIRSTFDATRNALGLSGDTLFNKETQDRMAYYQLEKNADWSDFIGGQDTIPEVMAKIAKIWASFPKDFSGASHYAGDGLNKALISPQVFASELNKAKELA